MQVASADVGRRRGVHRSARRLQPGLVVATTAARAAAIPAAPDDGGPRNWVVATRSGTLNLREEPSPGSRVPARHAPGRVLDNVSGCTEAQGRVCRDVQKLGGGERDYVVLGG